MSKGPPRRWVEVASAGARASADHDIEQRIGMLLEKVPTPATLGHAAHARVEARLLAPKRREGTMLGSSVGRLAMGSGLGAFSLFLSGAVIAAGGVGAWWKIAHPSAPASPVTALPNDSVARSPGRHHRSRAVARTDATEVASPAPPDPTGEPPPTGEPLPTVEPTAAPEPPSEAATPAALSRPSPPPRLRAPVALAASASRASAPAAKSTELAEETRLLGTALATLRQAHDGAAALMGLEDYLGRFPNGTLVGEARRARVDALLLLGRRDEALRALDRLDLEPIGRGQELLLIRGELRARHDCAKAIPDFALVLRHSAPPPLAERALFGRAVCQQQEGRRGAAREDAVAYLGRFPAGRFANAARRLVADGGIPSPSPSQEEER